MPYEKCSISSSKSIQIHPYDRNLSASLRFAMVYGETFALNQLDCTFELTERAVLNSGESGSSF
jgi:hypothetical protein